MTESLRLEAILFLSFRTLLSPSPTRPHAPSQSIPTPALKMKFRYEMKVEGKLACKGITTHCFFKNSRPVVIEERFPELCEQLRAMD